MADKPKHRSALDLYAAQADATRFAIPERAEYNGVSYPSYMSQEEKAMLREMTDSLRIGNYPRQGLSVNYGQVNSGANAEYKTSGNITLDPSREPEHKAATLMHEMTHHAAFNMLPFDRRVHYDSVADKRSNGTFGDLFGYGDSEVLAYMTNARRPADAWKDPLFNEFKDEVAREAKAAESPFSTGINNFLRLIIGGSNE